MLSGNEGYNTCIRLAALPSCVVLPQPVACTPLAYLLGWGAIGCLSLTIANVYDKYLYMEHEIGESDVVQRLENHPESFSDHAIEMLVRITQYSEARGKVQRVHYLACLIADQRGITPAPSRKYVD